MHRFLFCLLLFSLTTVQAADDPYAKEGNVPPRIVKLTAEEEQAFLKDVKVADGFEVSLFAPPQTANYPVFVAAAPDGTLYVSSDGNGSLGRNPHRGRILRLRDNDNDGRADEVKEFVKDVDSPRGLVWDHDRLYLVHPPHLSAFIDKDGDGVSDEQKVLVKNIAFGFDKRPADHTTNGLSLGIDGWLYVAGGDFGFMDAEGTDGRKLTHRGGGVIRVRPDGTGLEIYSTGTRNILEVAISPLMDIFARDNTNDGGGWNVRFHHFTGLDDHGYPRLYKNFPDECIAPIADYGGGSGCGAVYIDEPGFGEWNNAPFTCDWGTGALWHHQLKPKGATFEETRKPEPFVKLTRPTDADVDAMGRLYVASWKGATFNWEGPDAGYIVCMKPKGWMVANGGQASSLTPARGVPPSADSKDGQDARPATDRPEAYPPFVVAPLPDFAKASDDELVKLLESPSHRRRLEAQRELVRRPNSVQKSNLISTIILDANRPLASRVAALWGIDASSNLPFGKVFASTSEYSFGNFDPILLPFLIRRLSEADATAKNKPNSVGLTPQLGGAKAVVEAIESKDVRAQLAALVAGAKLCGLHHKELRANPKSPLSDHLNLWRHRSQSLLWSSDPVVVHTARRAIAHSIESTADLSKLVNQIGKNGEVGAVVSSPELFTLDAPSPYNEQPARGCEVLAQLHFPAVVDMLVQKLSKTRGGSSYASAEVARSHRKSILSALCRLHFKEGEWKGDSWGTRPDTRGPYYQPEAWSETPRIAAVLKETLSKASPEETAFLVKEMNRNRIQSNDALERILSLAKQDPKVIPDAVAQLAVAETIPADAVEMLVGVVKSGIGFQPVPEQTTQAGKPTLPESTQAGKPTLLAGAIIALTKTDSAEGVAVTLAALPPLQKMKDAGKEYESASAAFLNSPKLENHHQLIEGIAEKLDGQTSLQADIALLNLAHRKSGSPESRELSAKALEEGWKEPKRRKQVVDAIAAIRHQPSSAKILAALDDPDPKVKEAAERAAKAMKLQKVADDSPKIESLKFEEIIAAVLKTKGDVALGEQLFIRQTCNACHTVREDEPQKGPYLGNIAQTYKRPELAQNILDPNKTIAQGFASEVITMKDGVQQMGFITLESADSVKLRNVAAQEFTFATKDIQTRQKLPISIMPPGLVNSLTVREFASLLDYLEALVKK